MKTYKRRKAKAFLFYVLYFNIQTKKKGILIMKRRINKNNIIK